MQPFPRQTRRDLATSFPDLPSIISNQTTAATSSPTTGAVSTNGTDPTSDPPPPPPTSVNSTTISSTSDTTSSTTTTTTTTTSTSPFNSTDTTSFSSTISSAPVTPPPPSTFIPTTTTPAFDTTTPPATANFTTIVTSIGGQATTIVSQLPTALINDDPSAHQSNTHRTTVIAGTTTALFLFVLSILAAIFVYRRHNLRKTLAISEKRKERRGLLDGEYFDDDGPPQMHSLNSQRHSLVRSISPAPSLLKSRVAETGSIFREEVWPPPGFVDPISKRSSQVDLSKIVDDVMGPNLGSHERDLTDATTASAFSELSSSTMSSTGPLLANGNPQASSSSLVYNDPFGTSGSEASFYSSSYLPPGASPPVQPGIASPSIPASSTSSSSRVFPESFSQILPGSSSNPSVLGPSLSTSGPFSTSLQLVPPSRPLSGSTTPRKSSPLARALSDRDKLLWTGGPVPPERAVGPFH